jgi:SAM-dependent methyltransferase
MISLYRNGAYYGGSDVGYDDYGAQEEPLRLTFRRFLKNCLKRGLAGGALLEVGCGWGLFLDEARDYFARRVGTEFSGEATELARKRADAVYQGGPGAIPRGELFDCVISIQTIEHVYDPAAFTVDLVSRTRPGGHVVLATPDMGSLWRRLMGHHWPSFKLPEHVNYFDESSLSRLLDGAGLEVVGKIPYLHAFPLPLIASKIGLRLPAAAGRLSLWLPQTTIALYGRVPNDAS